ncbi:hypothetical protein JCM16303_001805 [Sporobolomyces ruberrimus]
MRFFTSALVTIAAAATAAAQSGLTIATPSTLFTCDPYLVSWMGGTAPYTIRVFPAQQLGATPLATLISGTSANTLTWTVNLAAGTPVTLAVSDSQGTTIGSAPVTIQAGTSTSCVGGTASTAASTGSAGATSASSSAVSTGATTLSSTSTSSAQSSASSAVSSVSSSISSAISSVSSVVSSETSRMSTATGASGMTPSASPTSGASTLAVSGGLGLVGAAIAIFA